MSEHFPLKFWCHACGQLLFRTSDDAAGLIEAVCSNRRCPSRGPRVVRVPQDADRRPEARGFAEASSARILRN